jgi:hypothetical protein
MTAYDKIKLHLQRHVYTKGQYKGDAPVGRRSKGQFRVIDRGTHMAVRFHLTDIFKVYPDGKLTVDCNGWVNSMTTKTQLGIAARAFLPHRLEIYNKVIMGISQTTCNGYAYYDGITFDGEGNLLTKPRTFEARRINKTESKEFMDGIKTSGFKDMFPLLYATAPLEEVKWSALHMNKPDLTDSDHADNWATLVQKAKVDHQGKWDAVTGHKWIWVERDDAKGAWSRIMKEYKRAMYDTIATEVTHTDQL